MFAVGDNQNEVQNYDLDDFRLSCEKQRKSSKIKESCYQFSIWGSGVAY